MNKYKTRENGEPNDYTILDDRGGWLANILFNGELTVKKQRDILNTAVEAVNVFEEGESPKKIRNDLRDVSKVFAQLMEIMRSDIQVTFRISGRDLCIHVLKMFGERPYSASVAVSLDYLDKAKDPVGLFRCHLEKVVYELNTKAKADS